MALIDCPECTRRVSSLAAACPNCGAPIASLESARSIGQPVLTTEQRSKTLKRHLVLAATLTILGIILFVFIPDGPLSVIGLIACLLGTAWLLVTRIRFWWHHS